MKNAAFLNAESNEYLRFAIYAVKRLHDPTDGLLAYSRVRAKRANFVEFEVVTAVHEGMKNLREAVSESHACIEIANPVAQFN